MLKVTTEFVGPQGAPWVNSVYFSGDDSTAGASAALAAMNGFWNELAASIHTSVDWSIAGDVQIIESSSGEATGVVSTSVAQGSGTGSTQMLPRSVQGIVHCRTGIYVEGREVRGRIYVPGLTRDALTAGGSPTQTITLALGDAAALHLAGLGTLQFVVWSRPREADGDTPARAGFDTPVSAFAGAPYFATLRSRRN